MIVFNKGISQALKTAIHLGGKTPQISVVGASAE
jgi:hypothetical protein